MSIFLQIIGIHFVLDTTELYFNKYLNLVCTTRIENNLQQGKIKSQERGRRGRDRMVVAFTITYAIGAYHH